MNLLNNDYIVKFLFLFSYEEGGNPKKFLFPTAQIKKIR